MPTTYNGIGTHYYGKKNVQQRPGPCPHCRRQVTLSSYDTRLWFVVIFIPIIPLGKKRIIDACPACRRHYVMELQKWETAKQLEISGAMEKFRGNPTPESAIEAHRQMLIFHQATEAAMLQKLMCEKFPDNAKVHTYLALALAHIGRVDEAEPLFLRALELRPDMPEARVGVAQANIRHQKLDEARQLLDFLEKPGAGQLYPLAPLEQLALAYQKAENHQEALALFSRLLAELPAIAQHHGFRKSVKKSEAALKTGESILPKVKFSWKGLFQKPLRTTAGPRAGLFSSRTSMIVAACAVALILLGFAISNEFIRRHRTLYVVNQFGPELRVEINGVAPVRIVHGVNPVELPEGRYQARISGPIQETIPVEISSGYWSRWSGNPVWVLNPGGAAIVGFERVVYRKNPPPGYFDYHYGKRVEKLPTVTHPFTDLPHTVSVDSSVGEKTLTSTTFLRDKPLNAVYSLEQAKRPREAADLAEWALRQDPHNQELLDAYLAIPLPANEAPRVTAFLRAGLTNRPVNIVWHRFYQQLPASQTNSAALISRYEELLRAEPTDSGLAYLLGRICGDHTRASQLFEQARNEDPANPFPIYALGYDQMLAANWPAAKTLLTQAKNLQPDEPLFRTEWVLCCLALGQFDEAEKDLRARLKANPADFGSSAQLCEVLAAQGKRVDGEKVIKTLVDFFAPRSPKGVELLRSAMEFRLLYALGDFTAVEKNGRAEKQTETGKTPLFCALIEQNRLDEAAALFQPEEVRDPSQILGMALAFRLAGRTNEAGVWQKTVVDGFRSNDSADRGAADLLSPTGSVTPENISNLNTTVQIKAAILANAAAIHPEARDQLNALARSLNVERAFPYYLIQRATAGAR